MMAASVTAILRLPLSSVVIAAGLTAPREPTALTLVVISVVVAHVAVDRIFDRRSRGQDRGDSAPAEEPPAGPPPGTTST